MIEDNEHFDAVPTDDSLVLDVLGEFVESRTTLRKDAIRKRSWNVLPWVEGVWTDYHVRLLEALHVRDVDRLLVMSTVSDEDASYGHGVPRRSPFGAGLRPQGDHREPRRSVVC